MRELTDERVVDMWSWAYAWRTEEHSDDQTDLSNLRSQQREEITVWMRDHDLNVVAGVIRDLREADIAPWHVIDYLEELYGVHAFPLSPDAGPVPGMTTKSVTLDDLPQYLGCWTPLALNVPIYDRRQHEAVLRG